MRTICVVRWNATGEGGRTLKGVKWQFSGTTTHAFQRLDFNPQFRQQAIFEFQLFPESSCLCTMVAGAVTSSDLLEVSGCERRPLVRARVSLMHKSRAHIGGGGRRTVKLMGRRRVVALPEFQTLTRHSCGFNQSASTN